ncbi:hypothetical protein ACSFBF_00105 [Variovorax sp. ZT5P49]
MQEFLLFCAGAFLLAINVHITMRIVASEEPLWRKVLILWMVWLIPFLGAWLARIGMPRPSHASPARPGTKSDGFTADAAPENIALGDGPAFPLHEHMGLYNGLPLLDWQALKEWAGSMNDADLQRAAIEQGKRAWLLHLRDALGSHFRLYESSNAYVLSSLEDVVVAATAAYVTSTRKRIQRVLAGIAHFGASDKSILLVVDDEETYYDYVSSYYPEGGEFAFSGGMFVDAGCAHFLAKRADLAAIEPVIAHEMTHSALSHLKLPRWLDEGLAVNTERKLAGAGAMLYTPQELQRKHLKFWDEAKIQEFWSGQSFFRTDDGNLLSYELARILVEQMGRNWELFASFASNAKRDDGGAEAARNIFSADLGAYACALLEREPDPSWTPNPAAWAEQEPEASPA